MAVIMPDVGSINLVKGKSELSFYKKSVAVGIELKEGKVTNVYPFSEFLGTVFVGDIIENINGQKVNNTAELLKTITSKVPGKIIIEYQRDEQCSCYTKSLIPKKPNTELFEITLTWRSGGTPVGLLIHKNLSNQVVIAMVESGTTASKAVVAGDLLLKVNNKDVTDKDQARKMIMESINKSKSVTITLERYQPGVINIFTGNKEIAPPSVLSSASSVSSCSTSARLVKTINHKWDVLLPQDVLDIMENNKNFFKAPCVLPPCIKYKKEAKNGVRVDVPCVPHDEEGIPFDPSSKPLKKTPKRVGSS